MSLVWHYTSHEVAQQIISTSKFRLTRQDFLDDFHEFRYVRIVASEIAKEHPYSKMAHGYSELGIMYEDFLKPSRTFVGSFSYEGDDISQWERYASGGKGVALGFDASMLKLNDVFYKDKNETMKIIEDCLDKHEDDTPGFINEIEPLNSVTKQIHFSSERETRMITSISDTRRQHYSAVENTLRPYINFELPQGCIVEVKLGPRARQNADLAWRDFVDPQFHENNMGVFRDWSDRSLDKVTVRISRSACKSY